METQVKRLQISRKIWLRGEGTTSVLYRPKDGKQCCLGIYLKACGIPLERMSEIKSPVGETVISLPEQAYWLADSLEKGESMEVIRGDNLWNSRACDRLMRTNDKLMPEDQRERDIIRGFAMQSIAVEFID